MKRRDFLLGGLAAMFVPAAARVYSFPSKPSIWSRPVHGRVYSAREISLSFGGQPLEPLYVHPSEYAMVKHELELKDLREQIEQAAFDAMQLPAELRGPGPDSIVRALSDVLERNGFDDPWGTTNTFKSIARFTGQLHG